MAWDFSLKGKRVELVFTDDKYTKLRPGSKGTVYGRYTVKDHKGRMLQDVLDVKWDNGSNLSLIIGKDAYKIRE